MKKGLRRSPIRRRGDAVKDGNQRCIQGGVPLGQVTFNGRGCTEEEARRKMYDKMLTFGAQRMPCAGRTCEDDAICTQFLTFDMSLIRCLPARVEGCPENVGFVCFYQGSLTSECTCA